MAYIYNHKTGNFEFDDEDAESSYNSYDNSNNYNDSYDYSNDYDDSYDDSNDYDDSYDDSNDYNDSYVASNTYNNTYNNSYNYSSNRNNNNSYYNNLRQNNTRTRSNNSRNNSSQYYNPRQNNPWNNNSQYHNPPQNNTWRDDTPYNNYEYQSDDDISWGTKVAFVAISLLLNYIAYKISWCWLFFTVIWTLVSFEGVFKEYSSKNEKIAFIIGNIATLLTVVTPLPWWSVIVSSIITMTVVNKIRDM